LYSQKFSESNILLVKMEKKHKKVSNLRGVGGPAMAHLYIVCDFSFWETKYKWA
jgi:hypothetical protein